MQKSRNKECQQRAPLPFEYKGFFLLLAILIISAYFLFFHQGLTGAVVGIPTPVIEPKVLQQFEQEEYVSVIIILKDQPLIITADKASGERLDQKKEMIWEVQDKVLEKLAVKEARLAAAQGNFDLELEHRYNTVNGFSGRISKRGLQKLKNDPNVERVHLNDFAYIDLTGSVPQVNASKAWNLSINGYNITGELETICVVDTGIDTDHTAFQDKILNQYCYCSACCPSGGSEEANAEDDNGHGTHVSGIAAGNLSTHTGVAPDAKLIAMKVCNSAGSCAWADIISGIDWCTYNSTKYNISVISISLGDSTQHNTYCNTAAAASAINSAVGQNISVVVAAGNNGYTAGISAPACIQNATPVGAVNSADSITYNRGTLLELLAPGIGIVAPTYDGATGSKSGTSMSTPHVSGAVALFRQYWRLAYNEVSTPSNIEYKMMITGKVIDDSSGSGRNYSRINILAALQPFINFTLSSAAAGTTITASNALINITSDVNLSAALLEWSYSNNTVINISMAKANGTSFYFSITNLIEGTDNYKVYGNDTAGTFGVSRTRTLIVDNTVPLVTIINPANGTSLSGLSSQDFNATIREKNIDTVIFSFDNATGNSFNATPSNRSGNWNMTLDLQRLVEGTHTLTVIANDTSGNYNRTEFTEFSLTAVPPTVTLSSPADASDSSANPLTFNCSLRDITGLANATLYGNWSSGWHANKTSSITGTSNNTNFTQTVLDGTYIWNCLAFDNSSNSGFAPSNFTVNIDATKPMITFLNPVSGSNFVISSNETFEAHLNEVHTNSTTVLFSFDNSTGKGFNATAINLSGNWSSYINISGLKDGNNIVTAVAIDSFGNINNTVQINFTVNLSLVVNLNSPRDYFNGSDITPDFNCSGSDNDELLNATLYGNWSSGWHANRSLQSLAIWGMKTNVVFQGNISTGIPDGTYRWNCLFFTNTNTSAGSAFASANYTLTVDNSTPIISGISSGTPDSTSATITWTTNEDANSTVNYGTALSLGTLSSSSSRTTSHSRSLSSLNASTTYYYNVTSCDYANNCRTNGSNSFTTTAASVETAGTAGAGGGGGGGGGSASKAAPKYDADFSKVTKSTLLVSEGESRILSFDGFTGHTLTLQKITSDSVTIIISSHPITITLKVGETKNVDLDHNGIDDLSLTLQKIEGKTISLAVTTSVVKKEAELGKEEIPKKPSEEAVTVPAREGTKVIEEINETMETAAKEVISKERGALVGEAFTTKVARAWADSGMAEAALIIMITLVIIGMAFWAYGKSQK